MKGNDKLLETLNHLLSEELTAINQYTVHAEMCENWGYDALHARIWARTIAEMRHAEKLIERILFLEGRPIVSRLGPINIGEQVPDMHKHDLNAEMTAVRDYNAAIKLAVEVGDNATKEILEAILKDEDSHVDEIEEQQDQMAQMGLQLYLTQQVRK
jgi:bacterioferritin